MDTTLSTLRKLVGARFVAGAVGRRFRRLARGRSRSTSGASSSCVVAVTASGTSNRRKSKERGGGNRRALARASSASSARSRELHPELNMNCTRGTSVGNRNHENILEEPAVAQKQALGKRRRGGRWDLRHQCCWRPVHRRNLARSPSALCLEGKA